MMIESNDKRTDEKTRRNENSRTKSYEKDEQI
jgi:hypothetical protein